MGDKDNFSVDNFTTPQLALFKEGFTIAAQQINKKGDTITIKELPNVLRSCCVRVSFDDLEKIEKEYGRTKQFDFADFLAIAARSFKPGDSEESLVAAFKRFDSSGKGVISVADFRHAMSSIGDVLTKEELDAMIKESEQGGNINYKEYAKKLTAEASDSKTSTPAK